MPLDGRTALVTAATSGIGFQIALGLARRGARVVVTGRDAERGEEAVQRSEEQRVAGKLELLLSDAASIAENIRLAREVEHRLGRLDILVNNAGVLQAKRTTTAEGLETTLATNFAGTFALTTRLLPLLRTSRGRIVTVSSSAYRMYRSDPFAEPPRFVGIEAYARTKRLGLLFTLALAGRERDVAACAVNPGMAWTPGTESLTPEAVPQFRFFWPIVRFFQRRASAERAAKGPLWLAEADVAMRGRYFDGTKEEKLEASILDSDAQQRAFSLGEELVATALRSVPSVLHHGQSSLEERTTP
jgi:NAD(P)-dependent dehydrogenase (short-subunit alcohol dehydrogenase family)